MKTENGSDHPHVERSLPRLPLRRRITTFFLVACLGGSACTVSMTGCEGLDYSAQAEGTGIQIVGAIVVLAKYHASEKQKQVAEQRARLAVAEMVKPVYQQKREVVKTDSKKKVESTKKLYDKKITDAAAAPKKRKPATGPQPSPEPQKPKTEDIAANDEAARLKKEKEAALARIQAEAAAELASIDGAWRSLGGTPDRSVSDVGDSNAQVDSVPVTSTRDRDVLLASARAHMPEYIAISVPAQGIPAERGGQSTVMLWNTRLQKLATDEVLVLDRKPGDGKDIKVEGLSAQFISSL